MKAAKKSSPLEYVQAPPFCVQVEPTEGCNLYCAFCGIRGIRKKQGDFKFMSVAVARKIAVDIAAQRWTSRIEFAMHGEPTMNPALVDIVRAFRQALPTNQLMLISNGGGLVGAPIGRTKALFTAGLNILALDDYADQPFVSALRKAYVVSPWAVSEYPRDGVSPHHRWPTGTRIIVMIEDIRVATKGGHSKLVNHCGAAAPLNETKAGQRCARPFRELAIRWDGKVAGCCNDFSGALHVGDITRDNIVDIWHCEVFKAMRRRLYSGLRDFTPCRGCDATTFRNGLLPDKNGRETMSAPTDSDSRILAVAAKGKSYAEE